MADSILVFQQQQAREALAAIMTGLLIGDAQTALFACEPVFGKLQAAEHLAGIMDTFQGIVQAGRELDRRYCDLAPGPRGDLLRPAGAGV